jgi:hypothetical protein
MIFIVGNKIRTGSQYGATTILMCAKDPKRTFGRHLGPRLRGMMPYSALLDALRYGDLNFCHRFGSANLAFSKRERASPDR